MNEEQAFWVLYLMMNASPFAFRTLFLPTMEGVHLLRFQMDCLFLWYLPNLHHHFQLQEVGIDALIEWFMTLFTFHDVPRETVSRIWDLLLVDGRRALLRIALAVLSLGEETLADLDFEGIFRFCKHLSDPKVLDPDRLLSTAMSFPVTNGLLAKFESLFKTKRAVQVERQEKRKRERREREAEQLRRAQAEKAKRIDDLSSSSTLVSSSSLSSETLSTDVSTSFSTLASSSTSSPSSSNSSIPLSTLHTHSKRSSSSAARRQRSVLHARPIPDKNSANADNANANPIKDLARLLSTF
eukprot:TRINITY_DN4277_c0_g1_i1.p1 TRINITY_DN4277_c0_g1~~TRINITY_DN4277_c0_g1_i1.p1  ORF type:complete len:348 (-),score=67.91 TRINITY_DN4277_c0_g1_i1:14-907(-)